MICMIDVQPLLGPKSGVAQYISGLLYGFERIGSKHHIKLSYFDFKRKGLPELDHTKCFDKHPIYLPGRIFSYIWKYYDFPSYNALFGSAEIYHFPNFIMRPISSGRAVVTIHDVSFLRFPQYTEPKNLKYLTRKIKETLNLAHHIIVVSQFTKDEMLNFFPMSEDKVSVIHPGIITNRFVKRVQGVSRIKLPKKYMLYVGNIEPRKNLRGLLLSFKNALLKNSAQDLYLVIAGEKAWLYDEIMGISEDPAIKDRIVFTGYVSDEDLTEIYKNALFFVFPSLYEGFGMPPLEAMAFNLPVIASSSGSLPEVLGDAALMVDPENLEDLAEKICMMANNRDIREEYCRRGQIQIRKYNWEESAKKTLDVYEKTSLNPEYAIESGE
ncbi:MAG: glycosyltransferase family 1 protein [Chlamydiota bacterium]|nr:glycosyltransferase family 1 protein [Chlamydiota bacterium]